MSNHYQRVKQVMDIPYSDLQHHLKRVKDIVEVKAVGDVDKQKKLAITMANRIMDIDKCFGRHLVSQELNQPHLAKIFLNRFKELTYSTKDYRREKLLEIFGDWDEETETE
jgi:hypothetical protein